MWSVTVRGCASVGDQELSVVLPTYASNGEIKEGHLTINIDSAPSMD